MTNRTGSVLVLMHDEAERPELIGLRAERHGFDVVTVRVDQDGDRLPEPSGYDVVVSMGAEESVYDDRVGWIGPELALVRRAVAADVPVLGICFGGQLLAHALGGQVTRAARRELGWLRLKTRDEGLVPAGPWLAWHRDTFTVPPGAERVAWSDACPHAFTYGPHLGLQFHPEITPPLLRAWLDDANRRGLGLGPEGEALLTETEAHADESACRAAVLFDEFLRRAGLTPGAPAPG
jgi:GMP synthase (glutamine-hydrolysing)